MCLMKFVTFCVRLATFSHTLLSFANLVIYLKSLNRKFLRDSAVQTIRNIVVTSDYMRTTLRILFQILIYIFDSFQFECQQPVKFAVKAKAKSYVTLWKNAFMNAVDWTFSWNDSTGKSRHSPESFDNLLLKDAQTSRCVYLHGSDERRLKLVNHKWSVWQWEPKLYFTWIVESSTRQRTPPPVISIMLDIC